MADRREQILVRLLAIANGIEGVATAVRNRALVDDEEQPAIQILDADEQAEDSDPRNRPANAPRRVAMTPEIFVTLGERVENVGTAVNEMRAKVVKAILTDATLQNLVSTSGEIRYEGCATGLSAARQMEAAMAVSFTFVYPLRPAEL